MTFWGYKDKKKDTGQYKGPSHHANHNPMAGTRGARGTSSLGRSALCPKSRKQKQGTMGPEEVRPAPSGTNTATKMGKQLKERMVLSCTYLPKPTLLFPKIWSGYFKPLHVANQKRKWHGCGRSLDSKTTPPT